jgi:tetratricopeptide (TPR) repeat protein
LAINRLSKRDGLFILGRNFTFTISTENGTFMDQTLRAAIVSAVSAGDMPWAVGTAHGVLATEGNYEGYFALVTALLDSGKPEQAVPYFAILRDALPNHADVAYGYGVALQRTDRLDEAIVQWKHALALNPNFVDACRNVAMGLIDKGQDADAVLFLRRLLGLKPKGAEALLHLGNIAFRQGSLEDARASFQDALRADIRCVEAWINLGEVERRSYRLAEAEICFREAIGCSPDARQAHFNLGVLLLEQSRWQEGFKEFQWRANLTHIPSDLAALPLWTAEAPAGARVGLWNDQGLGDAILFLRYAAPLKARGAEIVAVLPPALTRLAATAPGIDSVSTIGQPLAALDYQVPLASLPYLLEESDPGASWTGPYLSGPSSRPGTARLSVGLVWATALDGPDAKARNLSLDSLAPLLELPGIDWYSLQAGAAAAEIDRSPWAGILRAPSAPFNDFADTAAVVADLDLVISIDTSVAHLAGALGKPVWILLSRPCAWMYRWDGDGCIWYPTATLFRQDDSHDWDAVVRVVADALRTRAPAIRRA